LTVTIKYAQCLAQTKDFEKGAFNTKPTWYNMILTKVTGISKPDQQEGSKAEAKRSHFYKTQKQKNKKTKKKQNKK